jgi:hypothetical protein
MVPVDAPIPVEREGGTDSVVMLCGRRFGGLAWRSC